MDVRAAARGFAVERFYFGQITMGRRPTGELRLLAGTRGIRPELAEAIVREAYLPAPDHQDDIGGLALLRGRTAPFVFVQTIMMGGDEPFRYYVILPQDVLRSLSGNLRALLALAQRTFPTYEVTGQPLQPLIIQPADTPPTDLQEQAMLNLMTIMRDRLDAIESLLSAVIQGIPVIVRGAPPELPKRIALIEGVLSLLPPPTRYGVTFASCAYSNSPVDAQIRFVSDDGPVPPEALSYTWGDPHTSGASPRSDYARFIKSQLRLDTRHVIERTQALTPVAGWRLKRGDSIMDALAYGSKRLRIDEALLNHQPVEPYDVARILAEDITLPDTLRLAYIRHLLAFALVLDEDENTNLLTGVAQGQPDLERAILNEMRKALAAGKGDRVYRRIARWLATPDGFRGMHWIDLLQRAAIANARALASAGDADGLSRFLKDVRSAPNASDFSPIIAHLIDAALPLAATHRPLAETVFTMGAAALPAEQLGRLFTVRGLIGQLPKSVGLLLVHMQNNRTDSPPAGLLAQAAFDFEEALRPLIVIRLTELVTLASQYALLDTAALENLSAAAATPWGDTCETTLRWLARTLSTEEALRRFDARGRAALLRILLIRHAYADLAVEFIRHQKLFFPGERQIQFSTLVYTLFMETALSQQEFGLALAALGERGIKPLPLAMAYFGALAQQSWPLDMAARASELTVLMHQHHNIADTIQPELLFELFSFHIERRDLGQALRIAALLPGPAVRSGDAGQVIMIGMYRCLNDAGNNPQAAIEGLRRYLRMLPDSAVPGAIARLGRELGDTVRSALEATALLTQVTGAELLADYAYGVHTMAEFLSDCAAAYQNRAALPSVSSLLSDLHSLSGSLPNEDRKALSEGMKQLVELVAKIGAQHRSAQPKETDDRVISVVAGRGTVGSLVDLFRVLGGYFTGGKRVPFVIERTLSLHPLGRRASHSLLHEVQVVNYMLSLGLRALPPDRKVSMLAGALQREMESLWSDLRPEDQQTMAREFATDLQRIPELILMMTERYDQRVLQENSGLTRKLKERRQRPENALEFFRFMQGYFTV